MGSVRTTENGLKTHTHSLATSQSTHITFFPHGGQTTTTEGGGGKGKRTELLYSSLF